jgi:O-antigen ligase
MAHSDQLQPGIKQAEGTLLFRIQLWNLAIPIVKANPMWGIGLNSFRLEPEVRYFLSSAHNQFLHVAVELGIPALIAYLAILLLMGYMCFRVWKKPAAAWMRITALGLGWGQLAFLFFGLTDAIPPGAKVGIISWISLALISVLYQLNRQNTSNYNFSHG